MREAPKRRRAPAEDSARSPVEPGLELTQDPHNASGEADNRLEKTIGQQVKTYRQEMSLTNSELARNADISQGMLSKIENGQISPSLATLRALSSALNVPLTALFRGYEKEGEATFVKAGQGLNIERRGTRAGHHYQLLGHSPKGPVTVEPYLITLTSESDVFPHFQHDGLELVYLLSGEVGYRHGPHVYHMQPGDSLFFEASVSHGPEQLLKLPIRLLSVISYVRV